jgi:hypothetical protein
MGTPAVSPDGKTLLVTVIGSQGGHVWQKPFDPLGPLQAFIFTPGAVFEGFARFSRDGRWIAYMVQDKSGVKEVWVTSRQPHGARQQVSTNGGQAPVWNPAADELFYQGPRTLMSVKFVNGRPSAPVEMFPMESSAANASMYDVAPDGDKFLVVERDRSDLQPSQLYMLLDWLEGLTSARK